MTFLGTRPSERLSMFVRNTCDVLVFLSVLLWLTDVWMPWLFECIVDGKRVDFYFNVCYFKGIVM